MPAWRPASPRAAWVVAIVGGLLAIALRWYVVTQVRVLQPLDLAGDWGDAAEYYRYAWNLVHHGMFSIDMAGIPHPEPDGYRDPGYPVYLAFWMALTDSYDSWYAAVLISHACLGGITVACTVLALRNSFPTWLLWVVGLGTALWPHAVIMTTYVLTENLSAPLFAIAVLALSEAVARQSTGMTLCAGVTLAVAALTNAVLGPLVLLVAAAFAWRRNLPRRHLFILVVAAVLPLAAWQIRNTTVPQVISAKLRAEMNLVQGSWPTYHTAMQLYSRHDPAGIQTMAAINNEIAIMNQDRARGLALMAERMGSAPGTYLAWYAGKPALLWGWEIGLGSGGIYIYPTRNSPFITTPWLKTIEGIAYVLNGPIALLALVGTILSLVRRNSSTTLLVFGITATWITVLYGVLQSDSRYSIPFRGAEIALASAAVWTAICMLRQRSWQRLHGQNENAVTEASQ